MGSIDRTIKWKFVAYYNIGNPIISNLNLNIKGI